MMWQQLARSISLCLLISLLATSCGWADEPEPAAVRIGLLVPVAEAAGVPLITPTATHPEVTAGRAFVFRVAFSDTFQGQVLAEFARQGLEVERAAVLYDITNSYNRGMAEIFRSAFAELGGQVVAMEGYQVGETDFQPMLNRIDAAAAELIFLPNFASDVLLQVQQAQAMEMTALLLGSDSWEWQRLAPEPALEGAYFSDHHNPEADDLASQPFVTAYQSRYNQRPTGGAALTYDTFQLLFMAMTRQDAIEAATIQEGLAAVTEFRGVTGIMRYDDGRRDPRRSLVILRFLDGQVRFFRLVDP
jgi:branched-chain amino acid transport system substrate-binding protein